MKPMYYKAHITFEDGTTDSYTTPDPSDVIYMMGRWLEYFRVIKWTIAKVSQINEAGPYENIIIMNSEDIA